MNKKPWQIMISDKNNKLQGKGLHTFAESPRIGEIIMFNDNITGEAQHYKVTFLVHPMEDCCAGEEEINYQTCGDLYMEYIGNNIDFNNILCANGKYNT